MKRIFLLIAVCLLWTTTATAETAANLMGLGMPAQLASALASDARATADFVPATDDTYDLGTASLQWQDGFFDGVVTMDGAVIDGALTTGSNGGLTIGDGTNGIEIISLEDTTGTVRGHLDPTSSRLSLRTNTAHPLNLGYNGVNEVAVTDVTFEPATTNDSTLGTSSLQWKGGWFSDHLRLGTTGATVAIEDDTAASTCAGTATANGTTAVTVSTTCAGTSDYIFISRTSAVAAGVTEPGCWATNIVNGVSFDLDCNDAAEDSTFIWWIVKQL